MEQFPPCSFNGKKWMEMKKIYGVTVAQFDEQKNEKKKKVQG